MSLPASWIDRIFERCTLVYGRDFLARWEGLDIEAVKTDWARELDGFENRGGSAIAWALDNLPDRAPSSVEFKRLAKQGPFLSPEDNAPRLPPRMPTAQEDAERVQKVQDSLDYARNLVTRWKQEDARKAFSSTLGDDESAQP